MKYKKGTFVVVPNIDILSGRNTEVQTLFMWLCNFADENGQCFPSRKLLAEKCGLGVRTIDKYIDMLIELRLIEKKKRFNKKKNEFSSNLYQVVIPPALPSATDDTTPSATNIPITIPNINYTHLTNNNNTTKVDVEKKKTKKQIREETPYVFKEELELLGNDKWKVKKIIYNYFIKKKFVFENRKQFDVAVLRNLRPAQLLEGYTSLQIDNTMNYCEKNYKDFGWSLETVAKRIAEVANRK
jgi:hypothetical protein